MSVHTEPIGASDIVGFNRRSIISRGMCQIRSTKFGPAKASIDFAKRGPTPFKVVAGVKRENSISGRKIFKLYVWLQIIRNVYDIRYCTK